LPRLQIYSFQVILLDPLTCPFQIVLVYDIVPVKHGPSLMPGFSESLPIPADASGAYRPDPQATTKPARGHP